MSVEPPVRIVLVGLPGAGKSAAGAGLAQRLGWDFHELDRLIEERAGRSVAEIFASGGEPAFRALERAVTLEVADSASRPFVAAPGGGWVLLGDVVERFRRPGLMVHLRVSPGEASKRLGTEGGGRPLLAGSDPVAHLERLAAEREALYARADAEIDVEHLAINEVINRLAVIASSLGVR